MSPRYAVLAGLIRQGLADVAKTVERAVRHAEASDNCPGEDAYIDSVALNLHDFYSGIERIFLRIAASLDESAPKSDAWHRDLLDQMATEVRSVRPAVISRQDVATLNEYLRFRHVVRNVYAFDLDPERVRDLARRLPGAFQCAQKRLSAFADYLDEIADPS